MAKMLPFSPVLVTISAIFSEQFPGDGGGVEEYVGLNNDFYTLSCCRFQLLLLASLLLMQGWFSSHLPFPSIPVSAVRLEFAARCGSICSSLVVPLWNLAH